MFSYSVRTFRDGDAAKVNELALAAFDEFRSQYSDWPTMASAIGRMSVLADIGEIIVTERDEQIIGAVAYIPAGRPKAGYFDQSWPIIRTFVVDPASRGSGVGRALIEDCMNRARRDGSRVRSDHFDSVCQDWIGARRFSYLRTSPPSTGITAPVTQVGQIGRYELDHLGAFSTARSRRRATNSARSRSLWPLPR
jgi:predicted N-acetyltransferase YhbS